MEIPRYIPFFGFPNATKKFKEIREIDSSLDGCSIPEHDFLEAIPFSGNLVNNFIYGAICVENLAAIGGLAYLCFK